jgi:hypothetical protein
MAQGGPRAAGEYGSEPISAPVELWPAHGIDAPVDTMEPAVGKAMLDRRSA